ncbi:MAG: hypothetical protein MN733_29575 [Nitrososphaera sp.]|nr:hypothetical protein [Nitrososphaera sp.]
MENRNEKIFLSIATLLVLLVAGVGIIRSASGQSSIQDKQRSAVIEEVRTTPSVSMIVDNSDQAPLFIHSADGKAIDGADYQRLTGAKADASRYVTFPNIKLVNNSDLVVTKLSVYMKSKLTDEAHSLRFYSVKIAPGAEFSITPSDWAGPRAKTQTKFVEKKGAFVRANQTLDLDSEAMWMPGNVQDYSIGLLSAEFENGTKWVAKRW